MSEPLKKGRPNIFDYATKESFQDAMICWLLEWSKPEYRSQDKALHNCGVGFVHSLLKKHDTNLDGEIEEVEIYRQKRNIDVLTRINGKYVILIEDKTDTKDHSGQLVRYYNDVTEGNTQIRKIVKERLFPIYFKTGNQPLSDDLRIEKEKYKVFNRKDFLNVLNGYEGCNSILVDFRQYLQGLEDETNSYAEWTQNNERESWRAWEGLYRHLEYKLFDGTQRWNGWDYVPRGDFLGFWWQPSGMDGYELYLQIEAHPGGRAKLCFKVDAEGKSSEEQEGLKRDWHGRVMAVDGEWVERPEVMRRGYHMTVAWWREDWLAFGKDEKLDIPNTVENLKQAESVLKRALAQDFEV